MPKIASDLAVRCARGLGLEVVETSPALVPFTWNNADREQFAELSGVSLPATVSCGGTQFSEDILFTHRGLSGPGILANFLILASGRRGADQSIADLDAFAWLVAMQSDEAKTLLSTLLQKQLPKRLVQG